MKIVEYVDEAGHSPFGRWFGLLDPRAAAKVTTALARLEAGNHSSVKGIGHGLHECRIDWGPGYRLYFGIDGGRLVILLAGGTKHRQQRDIKNAFERWQDYRARKRRP